jgi:hypothetical protein
MALRVLNVGNYHLKHYGVWRTRNTLKFHNGLVRLGHVVSGFSDRDIAKFDRPFGIGGRAAANRRFLETCEAFRPEVILMGHADVLSNATLEAARRMLPGLRIIAWCLDALFAGGTKERLLRNAEVADAVFVTSAGPALRAFVPKRGGLCGFIPACCDPSVEPLRNFERDDLDIPVLFCGIGEPTDSRYGIVGRLLQQAPDIPLEVRGMHGHPPVHGAAYDALLARSRIMLNLNREEGEYLYSSDRIAHGFGNGLAVVLSGAGHLDRLLGADAARYFTTEDTLHAALRRLCADDDERKAVGRAGWEFYSRYCSAEAVVGYMLARVFGQDSVAEQSPWSGEVSV